MIRDHYSLLKSLSSNSLAHSLNHLFYSNIHDSHNRQHDVPIAQKKKEEINGNITILI